MTSNRTLTFVDAASVHAAMQLDYAESLMFDDLRSRPVANRTMEVIELEEGIKEFQREIRKTIAELIIRRLKRNNRRIKLIDLSDITAVVLDLLGGYDDKEERWNLLSIVKPLTETCIKSVVTDLRLSPFDGDFYDKMLERIRSYREVKASHPGLSDRQIASSPQIRAEFYRLTETQQSWDAKIAKALRDLRQMKPTNLFDSDMALGFDVDERIVEEALAQFDATKRETIKQLRPIFAMRKAEIWPSA